MVATSFRMLAQLVGGGSLTRKGISTKQTFDIRFAVERAYVELACKCRFA
jgi:hypothetical protein